MPSGIYKRTEEAKTNLSLSHMKYQTKSFSCLACYKVFKDKENKSRKYCSHSCQLIG